VLVAATLIIAAILLGWLLLFLSPRPHSGLVAWWMAPRGVGAPVLGHQPADARAVVAKLGTAGPITAAGALEPVLRKHLAAAGRGPVVVYLSAAGATIAREGGQAPFAYLLPPEAGMLPVAPPEDSKEILTAAELVDLLAEQPARPKLLILDAAQV